MPTEIRATIHVPGDDASRYASVTLHLERLPWTLTGCITAGSGGCRASLRLELDERDRRELAEHWQAVAAIPLCEPGARHPGDRAYELRAGETTYRDVLPAAEHEVPTRNEGPCRADARLAWWLARMTRAAERAATLVSVGSGTSEGMLFPGGRAADLLMSHEGRRPEGTWDPDVTVLATMESALVSFLRTRGRVGAEITGRWADYRRHYAGVVEHGQRLIFASYFCVSGRDGRWRRAPVNVDDGGSCYFTVFYDPATGAFSHLMVNGDG